MSRAGAWKKVPLDQDEKKEVMMTTNTTWTRKGSK